jgi:glycosyltransferase involved in cell wall biosynthesis
MTTTLTIAHVLSSFGMGGQERVALDLAKGQRALGHTLVAISLAPLPEGPLAQDFAAVGCEVVTVAKRDGFDVTLPARLAWVLARRRVNIVHTHNPQPLIYGAVASKLARALAVHTKHGANPDRGRRVALRRAAARLASAYVAVSELTAEVARQNREVDERKLHTIPNGIDLSRFHPDFDARAQIRAELGVAGDAWIAGTVGRLAPEKDQALLLRAAAPLLDERRRLVIVGDGSERAALEVQVAALGDRARFVHLVGARRDVPRLLAACDAFALSSSTEGLPLVIPEAMATALPVVSTAVGGIPGVIDEGATGFLVPRGDEAALRARLERLALDRALGEDLGRRGRALALERYSAERMVRDYLDLYHRILGRS